MKNILLLILLIPCICFGQKKDYKNYDKAVKYYNLGKNEKAKKIITKIIEKNPIWRQPNILMASILESEGDIIEAVNYLLRVYNIEIKDDLKGIENIANLFFNNGYYFEARKYFKTACNLDSLKCNPKNNLMIKNCNFAIQELEQPKHFNPINLGANINTELAEYFPAISVDGKTLVFTRRIASKDYGWQEDFYFSYRTSNDSIWEHARPLSNNMNTILNEGAFAFSSDMSKIVFTACNRNRGKGSCDLYLLFNDSIYNAGNIINTKHWESQASFSPDGKYLYFVSNRPGGYGGKDIWRSAIVNNVFEEPENLGPTINTLYDDISPFLHPDNLTLYFASNGHVGMGNSDLYICRRLNANMSWEKPENLGYPINTFKNQNSLIVENNGSKAYFTSSMNSIGKEDIFLFVLPKEVQADSLSELELCILTKSVGEEIILNNVQFSYNSYDLSEDSYSELAYLISYLNKNPDVRISIEGHTDNIGSIEDNMSLSEKRAKTVFDYLLRKGISLKQLDSYKGFGESQPIKNNNTESERLRNRRTSFRIIQ